MQREILLRKPRTIQGVIGWFVIFAVSYWYCGFAWWTIAALVVVAAGIRALFDKSSDW